MNLDIYKYVPSFFSQRNNSLSKSDLLYACLSIRRFSAYAIYKSCSAQLEIKQNRLFLAKSYRISDLSTNEKVLATYHFVSFRDLPVGEIKSSSGKSYFVNKCADKSYRVTFEDKVIGCFDTHLASGPVKYPELEIKMKPENIESSLDYEIVLSCVWFTMITVGVGIQDG